MTCGWELWLTDDFWRKESHFSLEVWPPVEFLHLSGWWHTHYNLYKSLKEDVKLEGRCDGWVLEELGRHVREWYDEDALYKCITLSTDKYKKRKMRHKRPRVCLRPPRSIGRFRIKVQVSGLSNLSLSVLFPFKYTLVVNISFQVITTLLSTLQKQAKLV